MFTQLFNILSANIIRGILVNPEHVLQVVCECWFCLQLADGCAQRDASIHSSGHGCNFFNGHSFRLRPLRSGTDHAGHSPLTDSWSFRRTELPNTRSNMLLHSPNTDKLLIKNQIRSYFNRNENKLLSTVCTFS